MKTGGGWGGGEQLLSSGPRAGARLLAPSGPFPLPCYGCLSPGVNTCALAHAEHSERAGGFANSPCPGILSACPATTDASAPATGEREGQPWQGGLCPAGAADPPAPASHRLQRQAPALPTSSRQAARASAQPPGTASSAAWRTSKQAPRRGGEAGAAPVPHWGYLRLLLGLSEATCHRDQRRPPRDAHAHAAPSLCPGPAPASIPALRPGTDAGSSRSLRRSRGRGHGSEMHCPLDMLIPSSLPN